MDKTQSISDNSSDVCSQQLVNIILVYNSLEIVMPAFVFRGETQSRCNYVLSGINASII